MNNTHIRKVIKFATLTTACSLLLGCQQASDNQAANSSQASNTEAAQGAVFFDDFSYSNLNEFYANDWNVRTETGHPGIKGASWSADGIDFHNNVEGAQNGSLRMTSFTGGKGENTRHTQICHQRKYLEGTYAARVFFRDEPTKGPDGDEVIQTFYAISPLKAPMDPDYSETDFEYLPNGGWGHGRDSAMWSTTWETFQLEPWTKVNEYTRKPGSYAGWRTLVLNVADNKATYYVDGELLSVHSEKVAPEVHMSMNFNLWFMPKGADDSNGPIDSPEIREYEQDIDWVFHQQGVVLSTDEVLAKVKGMRSSNTKHIDLVPSQNLAAYCGL